MLLLLLTAPVLTLILFLQIFHFLPVKLSKAYPESSVHRRNRGAEWQVYANKATGAGWGGEVGEEPLGQAFLVRGPSLPFPSTS